MTTPTPTAALMEKIARQLVKEADTDAPAAIVLAIANATPNKRRTTTEVLRAPDVYEALREAPRTISANANAVAVITCGWASPADTDNDTNTPPSLHPNRQRVALVVTHHLDTGETVSAIRFANKRRTLIDHGTAAGSLAEAVTQLADQVRTNRNS